MYNTFTHKGIDTEASLSLLPFDQAWPRASKKVGPSVSIDQGPEKYASQGAENGHFLTDQCFRCEIKRNGGT